MSDCMFDAMVDSCLAETVGFVEGLEVTTLGGHTFKVYSTVQTALDAGETNLYVAPGVYEESVTVTDDDITIEGA